MNDLEQGDALTPFPFNCALEYAIRNVKDNKEGFELNRTHHFLVYADDVNLFGKNVNIIKKGT
jgi:hypothetical protein